MTTLESHQKTSVDILKNTSKSFLPQSSDLKSFEEIYKTSYSHGLESIYALENVDLKSVRRIETSAKTAPKKVPQKKILPAFEQNELDLGEEFRGWMTPFIKREPIQVLELSKQAEKFLLENGKAKLSDLLNLQNFISLKGMGQGYLEEIQNKFHSYLEERSLDKCDKVDFASWLKCLLAAEERKKVFTFVQSYELTDLFVLTPIEHIEVRKLTLEKKQEWVKELYQKIAQPHQKNMVWSDMQNIFNVFVKPWIRKRGGFATQEELKERMLRISLNQDIASHVMHLLQAVYFEEDDLYKRFLRQIDQDTYCCDSYAACDYKKIVSQALTYFYKPSIFYQLNKLVGMLEREFSKSWIGYKEGYIEKVLRLSPSFRTARGKHSQLEIYVN